MKRTMKITQNNKYPVPDITADAAPDRKSARRRAAKAVVCFMISAAIAFAACGLLYKYDNKYTGSDARAVNGVIFPDESRLNAGSVIWLIYEWEFFPGTSADDLSGYRVYADIGGEDRMSHGNGVYRMTLMLPEHRESYAIELQEIFSASRVYINNELKAQTGDPSPDRYKARTGVKTVNFEASGMTEIMIETADHSWIYSGMTYAPAFGRADAVSAMHDRQLVIRTALFILAFAGSCLSVVFCAGAGRRNRSRNISYIAVFVSVCAASGSILMHMLCETAIQPWYTAEVASYYTLMLFVTALCCDFCGTGIQLKAVLTAPCMIGAAAAVITCAAASSVPEQAMMAFSYYSGALKIYCAVLITGTAVRSLYVKREHAMATICIAAVFSACLLSDRLHPLYEPVYTCWFEVLGGLFAAGLLAAAMWRDAVKAYRLRNVYEETSFYMKQRFKMQKEQYRRLRESVKVSRRVFHDMRHHVRTLREMAENGQLENIKAYLDVYEPRLEAARVPVWSENQAADAVINYYEAAAQKVKADYDAVFAVPPDIDISDDEMCVILGNLLENAVNAVSKEPEGKRAIKLRGRFTDGRLLILVENSYTGTPDVRNGVYMSSSHEGPGIGIGSVRVIAHKYGGLSDFTSGDGVFRAEIMIPAHTVNNKNIS